MRITYDPQVDALYIQFLDTAVTTKHLAEGIAADYDAETRLAGLEILDAKKQFGNTEWWKGIQQEHGIAIETWAEALADTRGFADISEADVANIVHDLRRS
jgi:uncharacterized protein YuzE